MTDTTVKIFSSTQSGAPTLANVAGNLIALLDACLVNGFGLKTCDSVVIASGIGTVTISTGHSAIVDSVVLFSGATPGTINGEKKVRTVSANVFTFDATGIADCTATGTITVKLAPAGWSKTFSGTNLAAYKSNNVQASGAFLRVDDTTTTYATVRGYESLSDINTGTGVFPTATQQATSCWWKSNDAVAKPWWIIANDRMVYIGIAPYSTLLDYVIAGFGDIAPRRSGDPYRTLLATVNTASLAAVTYSYNPIACAASGSSTRYMPRSYSALGSPVATGLTWLDFGSGYSGLGAKSFPNQTDNGIVFTPMLVTEGTAYRGELPGIFASPQAIGSGVLDDQRIANTPGYARTLVYKQWGQAGGSVHGGVFFDLTGPWNG